MIDKRIWGLLSVVALPLVAGCGSEDGDSSSKQDVLSAPLLESVVPMAPAGLHVSWKNQAADCDEIQGERKTESAPEFEVIFTVPGSVDNKHDGTAVQQEMNTYRVRCRKDDVFSAYSNEMGGTP